jgi:CBS domain-containing protein
MNISALCTRPVVMIDGQATVRAAARQMRDEHVGALVVTDDRSDAAAVVGVVTDRDLAVQALARDADPSGIRVGDIASTRVVAVPDTADVADTVATMREEGVRRLLVVNGDRRLVGIVTIDDLLEAMAVEMTDLAEAIRSGPAREKAARGRPEPAPAMGGPLLPNGSLALRWRQELPTR